MFEFIEQRNHVAEIAGESVDPVHQQDVDAPVAGRLQSSLQAVAVRGGAGGVVGEPHHDVPAGLRIHIRL
nr:hypothetical protein [Nocardia wallacei]